MLCGRTGCNIVRAEDFQFVRSTAGGVLLPLVVLSILHCVASSSLWSPLPGGGQHFNPGYLNWIMAAIPTGSLAFGVMDVVQCKKTARLAATIQMSLGSLAGLVMFFVLIMPLIAYFHILLVCGIGSVFMIFVMGLTHVKPR